MGLAHAVHSRAVRRSPGMAFPSPKDTYPTKDDVASYLQSCVSAFDLPVKLNAKVTSLTEREGKYLVRTAGEGFVADQVVVRPGRSRSGSSPWVLPSLTCGCSSE
jgi:putative flavoprotein involved in K+ transport